MICDRAISITLEEPLSTNDAFRNKRLSRVNLRQTVAKVTEIYAKIILHQDSGDSRFTVA